MTTKAERLTEIDEDLTEYKAARTAILARGQGASQAARSMQRADLKTIEDRITELRKEKARLEATSDGGIRVRRGVMKE